MPRRSGTGAGTIVAVCKNGRGEMHDDEGMDQTYVVAKALLWKHHRLGDVKVGGVLLAACSRALSRHWLAGRVPQVYSVQHAH